MPTEPVVVLVVDDEPLLRLSIAADLEDEGFVVFEAGSADEAIAIIERHPEIALVFTDVDMPGTMDGIRLAAFVRKRWPPINAVRHQQRRSADQRPDRRQMAGRINNPARCIPAGEHQPDTRSAPNALKINSYQLAFSTGKAVLLRLIGDQKTALTGTPSRWETGEPDLASLETYPDSRI